MVKDRRESAENGSEGRYRQNESLAQTAARLKSEQLRAARQAALALPDPAQRLSRYLELAVCGKFQVDRLAEHLGIDRKFILALMDLAGWITFEFYDLGEGWYFFAGERCNVDLVPDPAPEKLGKAKQEERE